MIDLVVAGAGAHECDVANIHTDADRANDHPAADFDALVKIASAGGCAGNCDVAVNRRHPRSGGSDLHALAGNGAAET